jgi:thiamine biosynthesis lipoprotein ApbE
MELRKYINETLLEERQRKLHSSYDELNDIRDKEYFLERYFFITSNLLNEGYSIEEVESAIQGVENPLSNVDIGGNLLSAGGSQIKEYVINVLLTYVFGGKNQGIITTISVVFADYDVRDILLPFKDMSNCSTHMPKMIDSVLEALSRYIAGSTIGVDRNNYGLDLGGIASGYAGNMFGEVIRDSNMGEIIADKLCKFIH